MRSCSLRLYEGLGAILCLTVLVVPVMPGAVPKFLSLPVIYILKRIAQNIFYRSVSLSILSTHSTKSAHHNRNEK